MQSREEEVERRLGVRIVREKMLSSSFSHRWVLKLRVLSIK